MNNALQYIGVALLVAVSAFFSAAEMAYSSVSTLRLKSGLEKHSTLSARLALKIKERYDDALGAILIGNNLANVAASSLATIIVIRLLNDDFAWVSTVAMTLIILTFGEIIPKVISKELCAGTATLIAVPVYILTLILKPVLAVVMFIVRLASHLWSGSVSDTDAVSEDDFENIIDIVEDEGVLDEEQCDLLQNALDFNSIQAYEIITPRVDMEAVDICDPYEKNINIILSSTFSRIPVYEETPDNIIGILYMNHVYKELVDNKRISIRKLLLPVTCVHKTMPLPDVLEKMKETKCHMVVVLDEYGGTMGILTMEDVLEQLVGEIWDETDDIEREFVCVSDTHFEAVGDMRIYDFFDEFDIDIGEDDSFDDSNTTVGGWVQSMLDGEASVGDSFTFENLRITVIAADGMRIERIAADELPEKTEE